MAASAKTYGKFWLHCLKGDVDTDTATFKVMLLSSAYTPDQDNHEFVSSIRANEITGTGYTANGATLTSVVAAYTGASNTVSLDAADVTWSGATFTARYAVVYLSTGSDATSILVSYLDFGADSSPNNGPFVVSWNAGGILNNVVA
jgi:hypothetical protein